MDQIKVAGTYRHYKTGELCKVIGIGKHSETLEDLVFYEHPASTLSRLWARPIAMWNEEVEWDGVKMKRFTLV